MSDKFGDERVTLAHVVRGCRKKKYEHLHGRVPRRAELRFTSFSMPFRLLNLIFPIGSREPLSFPISTCDKPGFTTSPTFAPPRDVYDVHETVKVARLHSGARHINLPASPRAAAARYLKTSIDNRDAALPKSSGWEQTSTLCPISLVFLIICSGIRRIPFTFNKAQIHVALGLSRKQTRIGNMRLVQSVSEVACARCTRRFVRRTLRMAESRRGKTTNICVRRLR